MSADHTDQTDLHEQISPEYMLLFRSTDWDRDLSPEQIQQIMNRWMDWFNGLKEAGTVKAGQPLLREGKVIAGKEGRVVADGPFAESKEAIAGYFLLLVPGYDEALAIARQCPALEYGMKIEIRPVAERCGASLRITEAEAEASAAAATA